MNYEQKYNENGIEIPFGAKDSELIESTFYIPKGMEAVIQEDKVIIRRKESEDERIRKWLKGLLATYEHDLELRDKAIAWLEKQGEKSQGKSALEALNEEKVDNANKVEPNQEWGEDEKVRKAICIYLDWLDGRKDYAPKGDYTIGDMLAWLEKQKPIEWNKEDGEVWLDCLNRVIAIQTDTEIGNENREILSNLRDWLKSLKQRITK